MAFGTKWKVENTIDLVSNLREESGLCGYMIMTEEGLKLVDGKSIRTYWLLDAREDEFSYDEEGNLEMCAAEPVEIIARKPMEGGLDETDHPYTELRKFVIQAIKHLDSIITKGKRTKLTFLQEQGELAEKRKKAMLKNIHLVNKYAEQEAEFEARRLKELCNAR